MEEILVICPGEINHLIIQLSIVASIDNRNLMMPEMQACSMYYGFVIKFIIGNLKYWLLASLYVL